MQMFLRVLPQIAPAVLLCLALPYVSLAAEDSGGVKRPCLVEGGEVEVTVKAVPDILQRCYEVSFHEQRAYVCVAASGTPEKPYSFSLGRFDPERVTKDGWTGGGNFGNTAQQAFQGACTLTIMRHDQEKAKLKFDPEIARKELDEFFGWGAKE